MSKGITPHLAPKNRLESFSDGVIAILITIMILDLRIPLNAVDLESLEPLLPPVFAYVLSFLLVGIYWNNHHHLFQTVRGVNGRILWANTHLLFWLSLVPSLTGWVGNHPRLRWPAVAYGADLFMCGLAYELLRRSIVKHHDKGSLADAVVTSSFKGTLSTVAYILGIGLAFLDARLSYLAYLCVTLLWLLPDQRIEEEFGRRAELRFMRPRSNPTKYWSYQTQ